MKKLAIMLMLVVILMSTLGTAGCEEASGATPPTEPTDTPTYTPKPTPVPTHTPPPTPTPTPREILLSDDFSNPSSGWHTGSDENGSAFYKGGWLHIRNTTGSEHAMGSWPDQYFTDFVLEVETKLVDGTDENFHTIACRWDGAGNYYDFGIGADGYYEILKWVNDKRVVLKTPTFSNYINRGQGETNLMHIECIGNTLSLSVNGHLLATVTDNAFTGGDISLGATALNGAYTEVAFDNIVVTAP